MSNKYTDVSYQVIPDDEECMVNAVQISKILDVPATTIRTWADELGDYLYIKKINGRWNYTQASIEQFKEIKLYRNKDYPIALIRDIFKKRGDGFGNYDDGLINPKDPLGYDVLAEKILAKNEKMMKDFSLTLINHLDKRESHMITKVKEEVSVTIQEILETNLPNISSEVVEKITTEIQNSNSHISDSLNKTTTDIEGYLKTNQTETLDSIKAENENLTKQLEQQSKKFDEFQTETAKLFEEETKIIKDMRDKLDKQQNIFQEKNKKKTLRERFFGK